MARLPVMDQPPNRADPVAIQLAAYGRLEIGDLDITHSQEAAALLCQASSLIKHISVLISSGVRPYEHAHLHSLRASRWRAVPRPLSFTSNITELAAQ